ncbi:MAG: hydrogenase formation protein HypD [Deltaproteobacteria bacterium]|nr:hydrogenase formation protein HypD [Deltaproteobacteria bacterium]
MKYVTEFRSSDLAKGLLERIHATSRRRIRLMEFCGGHTVTVFRYGIRKVLPDSIEMVSGPGCPVCVTANSDLDRAIALARLPRVTIATFGDMFKVPGSRGSLQEAHAEGADVRMVYSPLDALRISRENRDRMVIFLGIGFETTAPTVAASVLQAEQEGLENYFVLSMHKICPPALRALADSGEVRLNGLICPGHVSAITGSQAWVPFAKDYGLPCVVSGFEPLDVLQTVWMLVKQIEEGRSEAEIAYRRGVTFEGNTHARRVMAEVFETCEADWRGFGKIPGSGLKLSARFERFDAQEVFDVDPGPAVESVGCQCGAVLRGVVSPPECPLFRKMCTPEDPVGPCMVSSEGSCSTWYQFGGDLES